MPYFTVSWEADGEAEVVAANEEEAQQKVSRGLMRWSGDINWEHSMTDGTSVEVVE